MRLLRLFYLLFFYCLSPQALDIRTAKHLAVIFADSDKAAKEPLFKWSRSEEALTDGSGGGKVMVSFSRLSDDKILAQESVEYQDGRVVHARLEKFQSQELFESSYSETEISVTVKKKDTVKNHKFKKPADALSTDEIVKFIKAHFEELKAGKKFPFHYFVFDRLSYYGFELQKAKESSADKIAIVMRPTSLLVRMMVKSPEFVFRNTSTKDLLEFTTRLPIYLEKTPGDLEVFRGRAVMEL